MTEMSQLGLRSAPARCDIAVFRYFFWGPGTKLFCITNLLLSSCTGLLLNDIFAAALGKYVMPPPVGAAQGDRGRWWVLVCPIAAVRVAVKARLSWSLPRNQSHDLQT